MNTKIIIDSSQLITHSEGFADANNLVQRFCRCPHAKDFLEKVASATHIFLQLGDFPTASVDYLSSLPNHATLSIPKEPRTIDSDPEVVKFSFELFNIENLPKFKALDDLAENANIGMEEYAKGKETIEANAAIGRLRLKNECAKSWKIEQPNTNPFSIDSRITTVDSSLWLSEWQCHTDAYRKQWLDEFRTNYCQKNPTDSRSCRTGGKNFCYEKYKKLAPYEKGPFLIDRLCKKFFNTAPEHVKPVLVDKVRQACPQVLLKKEL